MRVYFIGAGPGDPELLTIKAARIIKKADIIIYAGSLINKEILEMMEALKKDNNLRLKNQTHFSYSIYPTEIEVSDLNSAQKAGLIADDNRKILFKLVDLGILEANHDDEAIEREDFTYLIKLNDKKFEDFYEQIKSKFQTKRTDTKTHLFIDDAGNFWLEPKNILCYPMGAKSERYKILRYLVDNNGLQDTKDIANYLGNKDAQGVRTEIGKIRANITKFLKIEGKEIIQSKKDSGYYINPAYKVVKV